MGFADSYLTKHAFKGPLIHSAPDPAVELIVVIPSLNEPDLLKSIESLCIENQDFGRFEILIILNSSETAPNEVLEQHAKNQHQMEEFMLRQPSFRGHIHAVQVENLPEKHAGVGLARKIGMDEAVRRFNQLDRPEGIICAFDADSTASAGFLNIIHHHYKKNTRTRAAVHYFEHPLESSEFTQDNLSYIAEYELFLRYFLHAVRYTGYPMAYHTVGSSFSVRAEAYCKVGGMNKRKAGEDFYFLQKIFADGKIDEITSVCVYPSPRSSDRVPFGTGRAMSQMLRGESWKAYNCEAFIDLRNYFVQVPSMHGSSRENFITIYNGLAPALHDFLSFEEFYTTVSEINQNTASQAGFIKRFYQWFNHFKIIRFLNESHPKFYPYLTTYQASAGLLELNSMAEEAVDIVSVLKIYRDIDSHKHPKYLSFCRIQSTGNEFVRPKAD